MKTIVIRWKVVLVFEIFFSANCFANGFSGDYSEICSAFEALQKNNSQQAQMRFFKAFPSNWYEFIKTYGLSPTSLYEEYDSHLSAFENLNMIDDSVYIERSINEFKALKKLSLKEVKYKLLSKGVSSKDIDKFFEDNYDDLMEYEKQSAISIFIKKSRDMDEQQIKNYLYKKGYKEESIKEAENAK